MEPNDRDLVTFLDRCHDRLLADDVSPAMEDLCVALKECRRVARGEQWREVLSPLCLRHPIRKLLHQDPYTRRAYEKPRGYAGDAVMLDYIYEGITPPETSPLGEAIFAYTTHSPNARSVVARRDRLAALVDQVADEVSKPRILALACGHLREAQACRALRERRVGAYFALDQDAESLAVVQREQGELGVIPMHAPIKCLLRGAITFADLDLVYAAGLYDYLPSETAVALSCAVMRMLAPGGRVLIANFVPENEGTGYMEAFMDWHLIYRGEEGIGEIVKLAGELIESCRTYRDPDENIVFWECRKAV